MQSSSPEQVLPIAQRAPQGPPQSTPPSPAFCIPSLQLDAASSHAAPSQSLTDGTSAVTQPGSSDAALQRESGSRWLTSGEMLVTGGAATPATSLASLDGSTNLGSKASSVNVHADGCTSAASEAARIARRRMFRLPPPMGE
jgi:hypothetical protein